MRKIVNAVLMLLLCLVASAAFVGCSEETGKHGHSYKAADWIKEPTCTEGGTRWYECKCGEREVHIYDPLGHDPVPVEGEQYIPATCQHDGYQPKSNCSRCGVEVVSEGYVIPITDHSIHPQNSTCIYCKKVFRTVTFNLNNGEDSIVLTVENGEKIENVPDDPQKEGHTFTGWFYSSKPLSGKPFSENDSISANMYIDATYVKDPYIVEISNAADLNIIAENAEKSDYLYKLVNDINMRGQSLPIINEFKGILDGQGHTVSDIGLVSTCADADVAYGFLRTNSGTVKNITFSDISVSISDSNRITHNNNCWGFVAGVNKGTIDNVNIEGGCAATLSVYASSTAVNLYFGGLTGKNEGTVRDCSVEMDIAETSNNSKVYWATSHNYFFGGIAGGNSGTIDGCDYSGNINVTTNVAADTPEVYVNSFVGGIVGDSNGSNAAVINSRAVTNIEGYGTASRSNSYSNFNIGGVAGRNFGGSIESCYASGSMLSTTRDTSVVGGLVGDNNSAGRVYACYSLATVDAQTSKGVGYVGGFAGSNKASIQKCYSTGDVTTTKCSTVGGFVGQNTSGSSIRYCYSMGDVTVVDTEKYGYFVGEAQSSSSTHACNYYNGAILTNDGGYIAQTVGSDSSVPTTLSASELWNEEFLQDHYNWDTTDGWLVFADDNPLLSWELNRGHNFESREIEPTHEYGGYTLYRCADCGRVLIKDYVSPIGHTYETLSTVAPTCTEQGYDVVCCTKDNCDFEGLELHVNFVEATGHAKGDLISADIPATCSTAGEGTFKCANDGTHTFTAEIPATGNHSWADVAALEAVMCTQDERGTDGYTAHKRCIVCGITEGKTIVSCHTDEDLDNICDLCGGYTLSAISNMVHSDFVEISDAAGLVAISQNLGGSYILVNDIDLQDTEWTALGSKTSPFTGILYGNGYKISHPNVVVNGGTAAVGLFAYNSGIVVGVTVENWTVRFINSAEAVFGGIVAYNNGNVADCTLLGDNVITNVINKSFAGERGKSETYTYSITAGGIAGVNGIGGKINNCKVQGSLQCSSSAHGRITTNLGNSVWSAIGSVLNNYMFGTQLHITQSIYFGGLAGRNLGVLENNTVTANVNVYATADAALQQLKGKVIINAHLYAGSLVGIQSGTSIGNTATSGKTTVVPLASQSTSINYVITGKSYEVRYNITDHGAGGDGKAGLSTVG